MSVIELSEQLINIKSITPVAPGGLDFLASYLEKLGFECKLYPFEDENEKPTENLFATYGSGKKHLLFAGHMDVVPQGDETLWHKDPFKAYIKDGNLYGRGTSDMKCAIAAFIKAAEKFIANNEGKISLLITGDEEGSGINGTKKVLEKLAKENIKFDSCLVGEPTSDEKLGDIIKIGRRGSISFYLKIIGKQGHVAYPQLACNPIPVLASIINNLYKHQLDEGNEFFQASNLEVVELQAGNQADNVIPNSASATINIRFNNIQSRKKLEKFFEEICNANIKNTQTKYEYKTRYSGDAFLSEPGELCKVTEDAVKKILNYPTKKSTGGGTSDARFIKDYCPIVELGLKNATAHKINEHVAVADIHNLEKIYFEILKNYFK